MLIKTEYLNHRVTVMIFLVWTWWVILMTEKSISSIMALLFSRWLPTMSLNQMFKISKVYFETKLYATLSLLTKKSPKKIEFK